MIAAGLSAACATSAATAAETVRYTYDARGRLVSVVRVGPAPRTTGYVYDRADNRTNKTTRQ